MKTITVLEHHHDSDKNPWRQFVSSEAEALEVALKGEWDLTLLEPAEDVLARAKVSGPNGTTARATGDFAFEDDHQDIVVWYEAHSSHPGRPNFGVGLGSCLDHTDKRDNCWISLEEWKPDAKRREELLALSKENLVQMVLEAEALR